MGMTRTEIETLIRAWATAVARGGDDATWRALLAPSLTEGFAQRASAIHAVVKDITVDVDQLVIDGDRVAWRWTLRGTKDGTAMAIRGANFQRVADGRVVEHWTLREG